MKEMVSTIPIEYDVIAVKMTWRPENAKQTGPQELASKLKAAAKDGWRLERLVFNNIPQGEGYIDEVTAYAVMVRGEVVDL